MLFEKRKKVKYILRINNYEFHLILNALIDMRNRQLEMGCFTDGVDDTILAITKSVLQ